MLCECLIKGDKSYVSNYNSLEVASLKLLEFSIGFDRNKHWNMRFSEYLY
mgnify:FL=1